MIIERGLSTIYTVAGVCDEYPQTCVVVKKTKIIRSATMMRTGTGVYCVIVAARRK